MENNFDNDNKYHSPSEFWLRQQAEFPQNFLDRVEKVKESLATDFVRLSWQEQEGERGTTYDEKIQAFVNALREEQRRTNVVKRLWRRIQGLFKKQ